MSPRIQKIMGNSRIHYKNGLRDLFVQIDVVLTFSFGQGLPRKCLCISPENHPRVGALRAPNSGWILGAFIKTFPGKSLKKMKGKDHIYLDK